MPAFSFLPGERRFNDLFGVTVTQKRDAGFANRMFVTSSNDAEKQFVVPHIIVTDKRMVFLDSQGDPLYGGPAFWVFDPSIIGLLDSEVEPYYHQAADIMRQAEEKMGTSGVLKDTLLGSITGRLGGQGSKLADLTPDFRRGIYSEVISAELEETGTLNRRKFLSFKLKLAKLPSLNKYYKRGWSPSKTIRSEGSAVVGFIDSFSAILKGNQKARFSLDPASTGTLHRTISSVLDRARRGVPTPGQGQICQSRHLAKGQICQRAQSVEDLTSLEPESVDNCGSNLTWRGP